MLKKKKNRQFQDVSPNIPTKECPQHELMLNTSNSQKSLCCLFCLSPHLFSALFVLQETDFPELLPCGSLAPWLLVRTSQMETLMGEKVLCVYLSCTALAPCFGSGSASIPPGPQVLLGSPSSTVEFPL